MPFVIQLNGATQDRCHVFLAGKEWVEHDPGSKRKTAPKGAACIEP